MASKKLEAQQIQHRIEVLDALALSGQSLTAFAQAQGISYAQLRGWQAHGARWRSQQVVQRPCEQPDQSPMQDPSAKPTQACDFIEARVVASRTTTAHPIAVDAHANAHASYPGVVPIKPLSVAATQTQSLPTTPLRSTHQSSSPAYPHDPPNPSQVQILCTQGLRSALVNWPSTAPLECAQWLKAYLA